VGVTENIATVRRFYDAGPSDDDAERHPFADPAIVWHVPGANHVSGRYEGAAAVFEEMPAKMQPLDEWSIDVVDLMANDDLVFATVTLQGRRGDHAVACPGGHVFRLDAQARIVEAWGFVRDQGALDALLDS
jgi:hypothetical protein